MMISRSGLPPLNGLVAFEAVARHLSFTAAARELRVTQGAISQQVKALEAHLGVGLVRRARPVIGLTAEGEVLATLHKEESFAIAEVVIKAEGLEELDRAGLQRRVGAQTRVSRRKARFWPPRCGPAWTASPTPFAWSGGRPAPTS